VNRRAAIPIVAAATFLAGFGIAELTGVRVIGGLVLIAGGAWCTRATLRIMGPRAAVALLAIALVLFVVSHPLGDEIGAWPAVAASAALVGGSAAAIVRWSRVALRRAHRETPTEVPRVFRSS
jgi:thiol:disulfide interchange protein